jgi:hypothetical protein
MTAAALSRPGAQTAFDAAADGATVVASVLTEDTPGNFDSGLVYSTDSGASWNWGGVVADAGSTFPEGVLLESEGAVIVGTNQVDGPNGTQSRAFMAVAKAPGFVPLEVDLPREFRGRGVQLQDIISVDGEWVVAGYIEGAPDEGGKTHPKGMLWRSSDRGSTWTRQRIEVPGVTDVVVKALVVAPDGSWNAVGQVGSGDVFAQYDALWLTSTDGGQTFTRKGAKALSGDYDQGATRIEFSTDGSAAILGWTEVTEDHGSDSALWVEVPGHDLSQVGEGGVPVKGSNPSGQFVDGVLWSGSSLLAWGSADGSYPMPDAQFWSLTGGQLVPAATLPGNGKTLAVSRILTVKGLLLAFGLVGDLEQADVGVWQAAFPTK